MKSHDLSLPLVDGDGPTWSRLWRKVLSLPEQGPVPPAVTAFMVVRAALLVLLTLVAGQHVSSETKRHFCFVPLLGFVGCMIPSAGIPVAGSIIFFPALSWAGLGPRACVAFGVATQTIGVGIFAPVSWLLKRPEVFLLPVFTYAVPAGLLGLFLGMFAVPLHGPQVTICFTVFCAFVVAHTVHGLLHSMDRDSEELQISRPAVRLQLLCACVAGGIINGWIGIGLEKVLFMLLTFHHVDVVAASVTGITVTGILSCVSTVRHWFAGQFPLELWLYVLPGVLLGSILGPWVNTALGNRNVLIAFVTLLVADIVRTLWSA